MKEQVVKFIQNYCAENVFEITRSTMLKKKHDTWRQSWLDLINANTPEQRSSLTMQRIQQATQNRFGSLKILIEEQLQSVNGKKDTNHRLDLLIPDEKTSIEICLSAVKNEFEKDIIKAMLDQRVTTVYILARDYVTGKREVHYGLHSMRSSGAKSIIEMIKVFNVDVIPTALCPEK